MCYIIVNFVDQNDLHLVWLDSLDAASFSFRMIAIKQKRQKNNCSLVFIIKKWELKFSLPKIEIPIPLIF